MSVTVIAMVTFNEDQPIALARYLEATAPLLEQAQARIIKRFSVEEAVVGCRPSQTIIMVEYPDRAAVDLVFNSDAYRDIIPVRDQAFSTYQVTIVTNDDVQMPDAGEDQA